MTIQVKPRVWITRAGAHGEDEDLALSEGIAIIGFGQVQDLRGYSTIEQLIEALVAADPEGKKRRGENQARQLWAFKEYMTPGDIVVLPLHVRRGQLALGIVTGDYEYRNIGEGPRHTRRVNWLRPDVSRTVFKQDLLYSFGAFMTVCRIDRHNAEERVAAVLAGKPDPGFEEEAAGPIEPAISGDAEAGVTFDIAQAAHDEVAAYVRANFQGHDLARLVEAVLQAEGFETQRSAPGPDGGADILAARGMLGLDLPTLCVQVKATEAAANVDIFRALQGTMSSFNAGQGLLVCWGGFTWPLRVEARQHAFKIRLWDQSDLLRAVYRVYDRLPEEIRAELPLKKVWTLVREEVEGEVS